MLKKGLKEKNLYYYIDFFEKTLKEKNLYNNIEKNMSEKLNMKKKMENQLNKCEECNNQLNSIEKELNNGFMINEFKFNYCSNCWTLEKTKIPVKPIVEKIVQIQTKVIEITEEPVIKITKNPISEKPVDFEIIEPIIKEKNLKIIII